MQVVEETTTGNDMKELTKKILKSKITKDDLDAYLQIHDKILKQNKYIRANQNEQEISQ